MNDKQEFLETLKDPTTAGLKRAARELLEKYPDKLTDIEVRGDRDKDAFVLVIKAVDSRSLITLETECMDAFCKYAKGIMIDMTDVPVKSVTSTEYFKIFYASWKIR